MMRMAPRPADPTKKNAFRVARKEYVCRINPETRRSMEVGVPYHTVPVFMPKSLLPAHDFESSTEFDASDNRSLLPIEEAASPAIDQQTELETPRPQDVIPEDDAAGVNATETDVCASPPVEEDADDSIEVEDDPIERLGRSHTARELREALRRIDLPTNGAKLAMARRLVEAGVRHLDPATEDSSVVLMSAVPASPSA
jgi:hypothetical protein